MNPLVNKRCSPIEEAIYQDGFQAGAASRDAEVAELKLAMDTYFIERNSARDAWKRAADARDQLRAELAAEQAKNVELRELVEHFALIDLGRSLLPGDFGLWVLRARKAIAIPSDTSTLETLIAKAGEVMREKCATYVARNLYSNQTDLDAIRALPGAKLEDLK